MQLKLADTWRLKVARWLRVEGFTVSVWLLVFPLNCSDRLWSSLLVDCCLLIVEGLLVLLFGFHGLFFVLCCSASVFSLFTRKARVPAAPANGRRVGVVFRGHRALAPVWQRAGESEKTEASVQQREHKRKKT